VKLFTLIALGGYLAYALAWSWPVVLVGLAGAMAWKAGAFPATFSVIGDALPHGARASGFTMQSVAVRLPRVISAPLGGLLVGQLGLLAGLRSAMAASVGLAAAVLIAQQRWFPPDRPAGPPAPARPLRLSLPPALYRLLVADCLVRIGEAVAASFIILYVTSVREVPLAWYGALYGLQQFVALASYVPAAGAVGRVGARPLVAVSFACFALFPLGVLVLPGTAGLVLAFAVGGFREFGEPARKSTIVDSCPRETRGRGVGAYYTVRNLLIVPAGVAGGLIWQYSPGLVLAVAALVSTSGLAAFLATSGPPGRAGDRRSASAPSARRAAR
jgi:predicted MFS family arabinose efflux permease